MAAIYGLHDYDSSLICDSKTLVLENAGIDIVCEDILLTSTSLSFGEDYSGCMGGELELTFRVGKTSNFQSSGAVRKYAEDMSIKELVDVINKKLKERK